MWTFQYRREVDAKGDKASWHVGWYDPDGKRHAESCGPGSRGKKAAERRKRQLEGQLEAGAFEADARTTWADFRREYETSRVSRLALRSREEVRTALNHFERIVRPGRVANIKLPSVEKFVAVRLTERGKNPGSTVSPATVNKDLRHVRAALRYAESCGYIPKVPRVGMLREPEKLPQYVTPEHFAVIYHVACPLAQRPAGQNYPPADWWRALVVFGYMTGWRIGAMLALRREDMDLDAGTAISRAEDNKGKRDALPPLHPVVVDHLRRIVGFHPLVFRWPHDRKDLWIEFGRMQREAGVRVACRQDHEHTDACHVYGFHDLRRAFATMNADRMTGHAVQALMAHRSYSTTQRYINMTRQLNTAVAALHVPDVLRTRQA